MCQGEGLLSTFCCFETRGSSVVCHLDKKWGKGSCGRVKGRRFWWYLHKSPVTPDRSADSLCLWHAKFFGNYAWLKSICV